jgi:DNA-binding CsgD family transcriptional regulator
MRRFDLNELATACYSLEGTDDAWLVGLVQALGPLLDEGLGIGARQFEVGAWQAVEHPLFGVVPEIGRAMQAAAMAAPEQIARQYFLGPRTQSACERIGRKTALHEDPVFVSLREHRVSDFRTLTLMDASKTGLLFAAPAQRVLKTTPAFRFRLDRAGAHILAGFRLRRALGEVDAVLSPEGKLMDAKDEAREPRFRETLRAAVTAFERAGTHRADAEDALESWQALVSGRWSIVQRFESDGRRYLLARRNPPGNALHAGLAALEAQALLLRAQAASYKLIAYELGLSASAAHRLVCKAAAKLGVSNEHELPGLFGRF